MPKYVAVENVKTGGVHYEKGEVFEDEREDVKEALERGLITSASHSDTAKPIGSLREQRKIEYLERKVSAIGPDQARAELRDKALALRKAATASRANTQEAARGGARK